MSESVRIVAVDCATQPKRIGLCSGWANSGRLEVEQVIRGDAVASIAEWIADQVEGHEDVVLGLDAPLGWPAPMLDQLSTHVAGRPIAGDANDVFRRFTDTFVHQAIGKLPLDVGADRIARTAHSALGLLDEVRSLTGRGFALPVAPYAGGTAAIETYPGGTLKAGPWNDRGYKGRDGEEIRGRLLDELADLITFQHDTAGLLSNDDLFDAVIAALGAVDWVSGRCFEPQDAALAEREGWIWVRRPDDSTA